MVAVEQTRAEAALRESEARFRNLADNAPVMVWVTDKGGHCEYLNKRWYEFTGQNEESALATGWLGTVHPDDADKTLQAFLDENARVESFSLEYRLRRRDGVYRWAINTAAPRFGTEGEHLGYIGSVIDISERKESEERQNLLMREIDHRAKNVLAVVQAVLRLSTADDPAHFRNVVEGRIAALARAHSLLSASRWEGVDLLGLLEDELAPYRATRGGRIALSGPSLLLPPPLAQTLALALHELATNAAKHGSLSGPHGTLAVEWRLDPAETLMLTWTERTEQPIAPPDRSGFGSELLLKSVGYQARGSVRLDWRPAGLIAHLTVPLHPRAEAASRAAADESNSAGDRRVLIVEDEALIALELQQRIASFGYEVVDCIGSVDTALEFARATRTDIALLDANLNGRSSAGVARELRQRGVPVAFITGYQRIEDLPDELRDVPMLTKPVSDEVLERVLSSLAAQVGK